MAIFLAGIAFRRVSSLDRPALIIVRPAAHPVYYTFVCARLDHNNNRCRVRREGGRQTGLAIELYVTNRACRRHVAFCRTGGVRTR